MAEARVERRLAAILAADVVGYSRLMEADEAGTLKRVKALRAELLHPKVAAYNGRIVKTTGDGTLIEFPSAVDAVQHAIDVQREMARRNADVPDGGRMELRMGINLGDIIIEGDDIYGDGVNVAARLESLAEPGGICISGTVHEHVRGKLDADFHDMGAQTLKNIAKPIHVYRVALSPTQDRKSRALTLPDKPSIAVLPFTNMSGDIEQEYFADGIAEDIIIALARVRQFFVIARNTTFTYKGRSVDVQALAKELGVRYVLEGSVRKSGNRVRITAQLIEGATGNHLWAERYDRELQDIFAVQDEITQTVVGAIGPELGRAEQERARLKPPNSLRAWDFYQRGLWHLWRLSADDIQKAIGFFKRAIELDPAFSSAFAGLSYAHSTNFIRGYTDSPGDELQAGYETAIQAVSLGREDALSHWALGVVYRYKRDHALSLDELSAAMELNPSFAHVYAQFGLELIFIGRTKEALPYFDQAERLSPKDPFGWVAWFGRGWAHFFLGQFDEAAVCARKAIPGSNSLVWCHSILVAALSSSNRPSEAAQALQNLFKVKKDFSIAFVDKTAPINDSGRATLIEALRKAGVPE